MNTLKQQQPSTPSTQSGFTLIECLVAIIIVSVLMIAIAPAIALSVATRLQARRVELGTQAARAYIDGVKAKTIALPKDTVLVNFKLPRGRANFSTAAAPAPGSLTTSNCLALPIGDYPYCTNNRNLSLYCVDLDGGGCSSNSNKDLVVQAFRSISISSAGTTDDGTKGYLLGVRVYRADAFKDSTPVQTTQSSGGLKTATFAGGTGARYTPLVEMTTEISPASNASTPEAPYQQLCDRLGGCTPSTTSSPSPTP